MITLWLITVFSLIILRFGKDAISFFMDLQYKRRLAKEMPGPRSSYFVGCFPEMPRQMSEFPQFFLDEARKAVNNGHSIMRIWFGPRLVVMPLDSDAVKVITQSSTELDKGVDYYIFERWMGASILCSSGERWHTRRKMLTPAFHFAKIEEYAVVMDEHARALIEELGKRSSSSGGEVNLYHYIKLSALDTIAGTAMGIQMNALQDDTQPYVKAVEQFGWLTFAITSMPYYMWFNRLLWRLYGYEKKTNKTLSVLKSFARRVIKERIESLDHEKISGLHDGEGKKRLSFLDLLLEYYAEGNLTMEDLREEVDTFMFGGHDTTAHALCWTLWCLASHPAIQERCYQEIIEHFGQSDAEFHTKRAFEHPDHFDPERFSEGREHPSHAFVPFSAGPRNCIGQKFAIREAKLILCHILFNFKLEATKPFEANRPLFQVVLRPELGLPVRLERRL